MLRQQILDAARELFVGYGYDNVSMRKVADKIEYTPTTIYLYFKDKEELLRTICEESLFELLNTIEVLSRDSSDPVETLKKCGRAYVEFGLRYPHDYKLTFMNSPRHNEDSPGGLEQGSAGERVYSFLRGVVEECIKQKKLRRVDVEATSQALWAGVHGVTSLLISHPEFPWANKDKLIDQVIDTLIEGSKV